MNSVVRAVVGKTLDLLHDNEEALLLGRLDIYIKELDNLAVLHSAKAGKGEEVVLFDFTTLDGTQKERLILSEKYQKLVAARQEELKKYLDNNDTVNKAALYNLLKDTFKQDDTDEKS